MLESAGDENFRRFFTIFAKKKEMTTVFSNPDKPFVLKPLADLPSEYAEHAEALKDKMAIIDDNVYCDNQELLKSLDKATRDLIKMQNMIGFFGNGPVYKPIHAAYMAAFIVQNGEEKKNLLYSTDEREENVEP